jgi:TetR/AcrR family transcriptional repressor of nem operon
MNNHAVAMMDAAERRMRIGGFGGFSFREIAADVGVKSSSVHYHFPTKEKLAAAVVRRYVANVSDHFDEELARDPDPIAVWTRIFRGTLHSCERICPATVLGALALDLPPEVAAEVKRFFDMNTNKLIEAGLSPNEAAEFLATITGAQVVSIATGDPSSFDRATGDLAKRFEPAAA